VESGIFFAKPLYELKLVPGVRIMVGIVQGMLKQGVIAQLHGKWALTVPLEKIAPAVPETLQQLIQV